MSTREKYVSKPARLWNREYLPGYTGFVPTKNDLFGKTAGNINKEICIAGGKGENLDRMALS